MPVQVIAKPIPVKLIPISKIKPAIVKELRKEGAKNRRSLKATTQAWDEEKPTFKTKITATTSEIVVDTQPTGNEHGIDKFGWLNAGTSVRFAAMTPDFSAKTKPGRLASKPGIGGFMRLTGRDMGGIAARRWTIIITEKRQKPFGDNIQRVILQIAVFGG